MTIDEAIDLMRALPGCVQTMWAVADVWEENEAFVTCYDCDGFGFRPLFDMKEDRRKCPKCLDTRLVSNGNSARAEALRLLAECGKVGGHPTIGYRTMAHMNDESSVPTGWSEAAFSTHVRPPNQYQTIPIRVGLLDAYAEASPETRRAWAAETRALTSRTATPAG